MARRKGEEEYFYPGDIPEKYRECFWCRYWLYDHHNKIVARVVNETRVMGQCTAADDNARGPFVEGVSRGANGVITVENAFCDAFVASADAVDDWRDAEAEARYYNDLDDELNRDAWLS